MTSFFESPVLNSPYHYPSRHWKPDEERRPTHRIVDGRRPVFIAAPKAKPEMRSRERQESVCDAAAENPEVDVQRCSLAQAIGSVRQLVDRWRALPDAAQWQVTPETARLLQHWRQHDSGSFRPFFCQIEAVETVIWLTEVAPSLGSTGTQILDRLKETNEAANPGISRLALKLATGTGKTTVMAMLIAWQTINAVRRPTSRRFTRGFAIITPGVTARDRLRVLQPNDPDSYFKTRTLVPIDMLGDLEQARIVVSNYQAFKPQQEADFSSGGRALRKGSGSEWRSAETSGQTLRRLMPELLDIGNVLVLNDQAHHCYRERPGEDDEADPENGRLEDAERNRETARLWYSGLESIKKTLGLVRVIDLSATPFFPPGSGYPEGTLFPWTMCDFSLMDAIECGIVKLPRFPLADNVTGSEMAKFRNLWEHTGRQMARKGRAISSGSEPLGIPVAIQTAIEALYGHYEKTYELWKDADVDVPPCFVIVCSDIDSSKLVYDYIAGFHHPDPDGSATPVNGRFELFRNFDSCGRGIATLHTLLVDSRQIESGEALDAEFRECVADAIGRFRQEIVERPGDPQLAENLADQDLLREAMNTVGKSGRLGGTIRCVVSVSQMPDGWNASTVTHLLGVRDLGTQLLCEQVVGPALRRLPRDLHEEDHRDAEYADVLGIPFDFTTEPIVAPPQLPRSVVQVHAVRPDRDRCEIRFPRVVDYGIDLAGQLLSPTFDDDSILELTPELVDSSIARNQEVIGGAVGLDLAPTRDLKPSTLSLHLTKRLMETKWRGSGEEASPRLLDQIERIACQWLNSCLVCKGETYPAQLMYLELADKACERIIDVVVGHSQKERAVIAILDPCNQAGSTKNVRFAASRKKLWHTDRRRCHVNFAICDSKGEAEFCRIAEGHPRVRAYVKNQGLGFEVPYRQDSEDRIYLPDFIVVLNDGHSRDDPLHVIVDIKGYGGEDAKDKKSTTDTSWVPGVNNLGVWGRWAFAELGNVNTMEKEATGDMETEFNRMVDSFRSPEEIEAAAWLARAGGSSPDAKHIPRRRGEAAE